MATAYSLLAQESDESDDETVPIARTDPAKSDYGSGYTSTTRTASAVARSPSAAKESIQFPPSKSATLSWKDLSVFLPENASRFRIFRRKPKAARQHVLKKVRGVIYPGQLVALMGSSGSGKTTLLNTLTSRNKGKLKVEGTICVNGQQIGRSITAMSAYVQQDDLFVGTMTCREHLIFQAQLRLPNMSSAQKTMRADQVLYELGLVDCQHTKIGIQGVISGISGGEAKRLAFASEILTNPSILFCDEPTTGLDSYTAEQVVSVLQKLAASGKTILCTVHQPASEIYAMFDRIMLLSEGEVAFYGQANDALEFFKSAGYPCPEDYNPADYFIHSLAIVPGHEDECKQRLKQLCEFFEKSSFAAELESQVQTETTSTSNSTGEQESLKQSPYKVNWFIQFGVLLWRALLNNYRHPQIALIKLAQKLVLGLFVGLLYLNTSINQEGIMNIAGVLYFGLNEVSFPAMFGVINYFPAQFPVLLREHHDGLYKVSSFYLSNFIAFIPTYTLDGILLLVILYFMVGLRGTAAAFFTALGIYALVEQSACAFGCLISSASPNLPVALAISGPFLTLFVFMGGLFANVATIPIFLNWAQYLSWFRYGFEALTINQWHNIHNISCSASPCIKDGDEVIGQFSFSPVYLTRDCLALLGMILLLHATSYLALWRRVYAAR